MPRTCTVCAHPKRTEIDQALLSGQSLRDIAGQFGTSRSALERHKKADIPATLAKAKEAAEEVQAETLLGRLKAANQETMAILKQARKGGSPSIALAAISRIEKQVELEARLLGQLEASKLAVGMAVGIQVGAPGPYYAELSKLSDEELAAREEQIELQLEAARRAAGDSGG